MDPYGPVWVRMVPEDSLGASWGLLGPWGARKGGYMGFDPGGAGGALLGGLPIRLRGILTYMPLGLLMYLDQVGQDKVQSTKNANQ